LRGPAIEITVLEPAGDTKKRRVTLHCIPFPIALTPERNPAVSLTAFSLRTLPDQALLRALHELAARGRELEADLLAHLAEVDARELYLAQGYASMFGYCTEALHFSEACAYQRISAARAARAYPLLLERVRSGELHLAGVRLLAPQLTAENHVELIERAKHLSKRAIEEMLADRAPKPDAPPLVRRLPVQPDGPCREPDRTSGFATALLAPSPATTASAPATDLLPAAPVATAPPERPPVSRCLQPEPLGARRYKVQFTANEGTYAKLREAQALLRHTIPDGDLAQVFDRALTVLLREVRRARFAETENPRWSDAARSATPGPSRHIPAAVRREVNQRDGGRCTFVGTNGHRCDSREALEFHHVEPFARSPHHSVEGITLRCRAHNRHAAVQDFGAEHMSRFRKRRGAEAPIATGPGTSSTAPPLG
jgi:5-methylcytosine-specific restriction endonuclease McrA